MKATFFLLGLLPLGMAFPAIGPAMKRDLLDTLKQKRIEEATLPKLERRQGLLDTLLNDVTGLLGSVASNISPDNKRPEPGYTFEAPGPNDSRGPCPALNLLANYGYLPRNGYVNFGQIVEATARGFNMGTDLSTILAVFAVLADGDIATESWYLGTNPSTKVGGLNRHSTVEADVSPNREDYYLGCGDNHHLSSRLFKQNVQFASEDPDRQFTFKTMAKQWAANAKFSQDNNPYLYFFPFPSIVAVVAFNFYPAYFSNGTYGAGGVANYESISSIIGAKLNKETGEFEYVPERWPEQGWYRRSTEYGAVQALTEGFTAIYPSYPLPMAVPQLGSDNLNVSTVLCDIYQGINSITPLALAGQSESLVGSVSWALGKLAAVGISDSILGCPTSTLSPNFLTANDAANGGPLSPPPAVVKNVGNNVYNKVYFTNPPTEPQC